MTKETKIALLLAEALPSTPGSDIRYAAAKLALMTVADVEAIRVDEATTKEGAIGLLLAEALPRVSVGDICDAAAKLAVMPVDEAEAIRASA